MRVGDEGLQRLQGAKVVVVGLGAVGSFATEALARSAIGTLRLVDFDNLQPSNLNRQLYALKETMGCLRLMLLHSGSNQSIQLVTSKECACF